MHPITYLKTLLIDDVRWVINHSWSLRFVFIAFLLSCAEAFMTVFVDARHSHPAIFAGTLAFVTGAAFVARLVAQKHAEENGS